MNNDLLQVFITLGYFGIFLSVYLEHLFPPLPTHLVVPLVGILVGQGEFNFWGALLAACLGAISGSYTLYWLGWWSKNPFLKRYQVWLKLTEERLARMETFFDRYGSGLLFGMHAVPISPARVFVSLWAGANHMSSFKFLLVAGGGSCLWLAAQLYVTAYVGAELNLQLAPEHLLVLSVVSALSLVAMVWYWRRQSAYAG